MNRHFFEFWGQLFLTIAKGQQQAEELNQMLCRSMEGFDIFRNAFCKAYGLDISSKALSGESDARGKVSKDLQASCQPMMAFWGTVSKTDYDSLARQCETAEKKLKAQEETIRQLQALLDERSGGTIAAAGDMQALLAKQQAEFQTLMNAMGLLLQKTDKAPTRKNR